MSLSCSCGEWEGEGWYYVPNDDFSVLKSFRRKRCSSCKKFIQWGSLVVKFERYRSTCSDVEDKIYGDCCDEVPLAPWYMCEQCGEHYFNLSAAGYCVDLNDNVLDLLREYHEHKGFVPINKESKL